MPALLLVGHGSLRNPAAALPIYRLTDATAATGLFDDVRCAFWKEEPTIAQAMASLAGHDLVVLPVFAADSYYTDTLIARELGITPGGRRPELAVDTVRNGSSLRYTRPLGSHRLARQAALDDAAASARAAGMDPANTALVLAGKGGQRRSAGRATAEQASILAASGVFAEAVAWFPWDTDQPHWTELTSARDVVILPYVLADWWFSSEALPPEFADVPNRNVTLAAPFGCPDDLLSAVLELAGIDGMTFPAPSSPRPGWDSFLARAADGAAIGETSVRPVAPGLYEIRPLLDAGRSDLETLVTPEGVRDRSRINDGGQHRPIRTLRDSPRGWRAVLQANDLEAAIDWLYPGVLDQAQAFEEAELMFTPWPAVARRQTGTDARARHADEETIKRIGRELCSQCLRTRPWAGETLRGTVLSGAPGLMPCPEACALFIMRARDAVTNAEAASRQ